MIIKASLHSEVEISDREANEIARSVLNRILDAKGAIEDIYISADGSLIHSETLYGNYEKETFIRVATELDKAILTVTEKIPKW